MLNDFGFKQNYDVFIAEHQLQITIAIKTL